MQNLSLTLSWYLACVSVLAFSVSLLVYLTYPHLVQAQSGPSYKIYQALPGQTNEQEVKITVSDARAALVRGFFKDYAAPLADQAEVFVQIADKYGLDYRLLPAIAMQESGGGKVLPNNSYNAFGFGIYGSQVLRFNSWEEAIDRVARGLKADYIDIGLKTPQQIMAKYTPQSVEKGGPWAIGVESFMYEIR